jgi:Zn-dependent alcohol dehydrogenase
LFCGIPQEIELDKFITQELPFEKINDAFNLMLEGKSLRCVMKM